jgi:hypothetical protein
MGTVSRGFKGRRPSAELPPGQYLVEDFPILSAGPTPSIDLEGSASGDSVQALGQGRLANKGFADAVFAIMAKGGEGAHVRGNRHQADGDRRWRQGRGHRRGNLA